MPGVTKVPVSSIRATTTPQPPPRAPPPHPQLGHGYSQLGGYQGGTTTCSSRHNARRDPRTPTSRTSPGSGRSSRGHGTPCRAGSCPPLAPPGCLLTQVPLPHPGMLVLGPRQCGNRIRAARLRLSTPAKECERLRQGEGARPGHHRGIPPVPLLGKGKSLLISVLRGVGIAGQPAAKRFGAHHA